MKHRSLTNALPIVAAAYGRKFGVSVQVGGTTACTDGHTIKIPTIGEDPNAQALAWGYLAHEAAHIRHTDFDQWQSLVTQASPLTVAIANILEDVRIENALMRPYPGTRGTLDAVMGWLVDGHGVRAPSEADRPAQVLANGLLVLARHRYRQQACLDELAKESERVMRTMFPASCIHRLLGLMAEIPTTQSTHDTVELARRLVELIEDETEPSPAPQSDANGPGGEGGEDGDRGGGDAEGSAAESEGSAGAGGQESSGNGDAQDGSQTPPTGEGGNDQDADNGQADQDQGVAAGASQGADTDARCAVLRAVLAAGKDDFDDPFAAVVAELSRQSEQTERDVLLPLLEQYQGYRDAGVAALRRVKAESAKLSSRLQGLVQAKTMAKTRSVRQGRALSPSHLHRAAVGDARIFAVRDQRPAPNTAIHLLVDLSESMRGGRDAVACDAALALALALEPIRGVTCAITAFPGLNRANRAVTRILSHGDRVMARAGAFVQGARGGTPMTGALWFAASDLLARREVRRVILTLTDGEPDDLISTREMIDRAATTGLEMIGIGIGVRVDHLFPVAVSIQAVGDLRKAFFGIAEQLLIN